MKKYYTGADNKITDTKMMSSTQVYVLEEEAQAEITKVGKVAVETAERNGGLQAEIDELKDEVGRLERLKEFEWMYNELCK